MATKKTKKKVVKKVSKKVELKTKKSKESVKDYITSIKDERRREDAKELHKIMEEITKEKGVMWDASIVGYGTYTFVSPATGRTGDWMMTGWSSRAQSLTLYIMPGYQFDDMQDLLEKLGPHKTGKSCLYIKHLDDIHLPTLKRIVKFGLTNLKNKTT